MRTRHHAVVDGGSPAHCTGHNPKPTSPAGVEDPQAAASKSNTTSTPHACQDLLGLHGGVLPRRTAPTTQCRSSHSVAISMHHYNSKNTESCRASTCTGHNTNPTSP